ncbi:histidine phosphatase family protein [Saxibacter everestensis]|uniref:Histidine phosphatase family protein n=1 Tax=Saxibacter everestensis TaxID=2909229 RepID=A0ABY8QPU2_9MICO|nr:histidine phosphatase family protein [Brevibacteriaceae bacterium ZFBP1038]
MAMTTIHLLRHGEVHNPRGILYGRLPDFHLSENGLAMANRMAEVLGTGEYDIRAIVSSPLERARETAGPLAEKLGLQVSTDERVIEAGNQLEGLKVDRTQLARPNTITKLWNPFRPSWGESYRAQTARMRAAVASLAQRVDGAHGVIVSHQLPIWVTRLEAEGRPLWHDPRKRECGLASLTSLTFDNGILSTISYREPVANLYVSKAVPGA